MNQCVLCERNSEEVPLIAFEYKGEDYFVCTGHLPTLLHKPEMFEGKLKNVAGRRVKDITTTIKGHMLYWKLFIN
jgi:hypothetical protein